MGCDKMDLIVLSVYQYIIIAYFSLPIVHIFALDFPLHIKLNISLSISNKLKLPLFSNYIQLNVHQTLKALKLFVLLPGLPCQFDFFLASG